MNRLRHRPLSLLLILALLACAATVNLGCRGDDGPEQGRFQVFD